MNKTSKMFFLRFYIAFAFCCVILNTTAQEVFDLKGKSVILKPDAGNSVSNFLYTDAVLEKLKFKKDFLANYDIIGKVVRVKDVLHTGNYKDKRQFFSVQQASIPKSRKEESICLILENEDGTFVLRIPLYIPYGERGIYISQGSLLKVGSGSMAYVESPKSVHINFFDAELINQLTTDYKDVTVFPISGLTWATKPCKIKELSFKGGTGVITFEAKDTTFIWNYSSNEQLLFLKDKLAKCKEMADNLLAKDTSYITAFKQKYIGRDLWTAKDFKKCRCTTVEISYNYNDKNPQLDYYAIIDSLKRHAQSMVLITEDFDKKFLTQEEYIAKQKKIEAERLEFELTQEQKRKEIELEEANYMATLIQKFGKNNAQLIMNGEVRIGFTKQMCEEAWGAPDFINTTITANRKWEQWVYGLSSYLYFEGNKLVVIQN